MTTDTVSATASAAALTSIACASIIAGNNDRTVFDETALQALAESIKQGTLAQPITVRPMHEIDPTVYQIIAGERRFRACSTILGWTEIPCIVRDLTDEEAASVMLLENTSRADLDPIDEANAYDKRMKLYNWTAATCAERAGVSVNQVNFRLRLLTLLPDIQALVRCASLPLGHASHLALAGLDGNLQLLVIRKFNENPKPTYGWFKDLVNQLAEKAQQTEAFNGEEFSLEAAEEFALKAEAAIPEFPVPTTHEAPFCPDETATLRDHMEYQILFWEQTASDWDRFQKSNKRNECLAAAAALKAFLCQFPASRRKPPVRSPKVEVTDITPAPGTPKTRGKRTASVVHTDKKALVPA